jgi:MFS family permease
MYGLIMSVFSFASFCGNPFYGIWVDKGGNKFRTPYIASFLLAIFGAILFFFGNAAPSPSSAVAMIFVGRLFSGLGGANQSLGFAYLASVVPLEQQTKTSTILSMMRIIGMTSGPLVNLLLSKINTTFSLFGFQMAIDPLNSVGLVLAMGNLLTLSCVVLFLDEPPQKEKKIQNVLASSVGGAPSRQMSIWDGILKIEILLPIFTLLVVNSSFQLYVCHRRIRWVGWGRPALTPYLRFFYFRIETAFPPAAADGLGWGPVQTSAVLGGTSIVIFFCMVLTIFLSGKYHDLFLVAVGNVFWIVGGLGMYLFWKRDARRENYVIPIVIACMGFPFIASCNRSTFTKAVANTPALEEYVALMQSVLSMSASVAGFV